MPYGVRAVLRSSPTSNILSFSFFVTAGNVRISPEFASAKWADVVGRIDFFIPVAKWGIEMETGVQNIIPVLKTLEPMERGFVQVI